MRSELVSVREELNKIALARDLLDHQKLEADAILSQMEKNRSKSYNSEKDRSSVNAL